MTAQFSAIGSASGSGSSSGTCAAGALPQDREPIFPEYPIARLRMDSAKAAFRGLGEALDGALLRLEQAAGDLRLWSPPACAGSKGPSRLPSLDFGPEEAEPEGGIGRSPKRASTGLRRWGDASPCSWSPVRRWRSGGLAAPEDANEDLPEPPAELLAPLRAIERASQAAGRPFADADFARPVGGRVVSWCRPHEINRHDGRPLGGAASCVPCTAARRPAWQLFRGSPRADDVLQGELGDCWFLSSLAALAEFRGGRFVRALLPGQDAASPFGAYLVRLCLGGRWQAVLVDDRLPCLGGFGYYTQLAYCVTHRLQLWASIIEKGYAKACGSYQALRGGESGEALSALTGWPCTLVRFDRKDFDRDILWATLCSARDAEFLMTCSTKKVRSSWLMPDHVYSLMSVYEAFDAVRGDVRLVKIRNPNGLTKWQGAWSNASSLWTPELRRQCGCPEGGQQDVFFMAFGDFLQEFSHCTICRIRSDDWHEARRAVELQGAGVPSFGLSLEASETTECSLSLVQPEERVRGGPLYRDLQGHPACVGFVVVDRGDAEASSSQVPEAAASAHMRARAGVSADCWLQPGRRYMLVPLCLDPHEAAPAPLPAAVACVSSRPVSLGEPCPLGADDVRAAWAAYARANDPCCVDFHGATLHLGKAEGGSVVVFVENWGEGSLQVELTLKSDSLRYSRGQPKTSDWVEPGCGQILQVAQPQAPGGFCSGWRSEHRFCMLERRPPGPAHSPCLASEAVNLHAPFRLAA